MANKKLLDKAIQQLDEDRKNISDVFKDMKAMMEADPQQYPINGLTFSKFAELMTKQTSQLIDLIKATKEEDAPISSLDDEDLDYVAKAIEEEGAREKDD